MAARIEDQLMTAEFGGRVVATAQYSPDAAADGQGGWIVSGLPRRLFSRDQVITAMGWRNGSPRATAVPGTVPPWTAVLTTLLALVSTAALGHAIHTWAAGADGGLDALITRAFIGLRDFPDTETAPGPATRR